MYYCSRCGAENHDNAAVCHKCGTPAQATATVANQATERVPNGISGMVCGILGFVLDWVPIVGFVLSIVALSLCSKGKRAAMMFPGRYTGTSLLTVGQIFGILGIILSSIILLITIVWGIFLGEGFWAIFELLDI